MGTQEISSNLSIYRKFLFAGFTRTFLGRLTSLFYIIVVSRLATNDPNNTYDIVIILAAVQLIITKLATLGLHYSAVHFSKGNQRLKDTALVVPIQAAVFIGIPLSILLWELSFSFIVLFNVNERLVALQPQLLVRIIFDVFIGLSVLGEAVKVQLNSKLKADQVSWFTTIYSVVISFVIPLFYYLHPGLISFMVGWTLVIILPLLIWRKEIITALFSSYNLSESKTIIRFGLPIFFISIFSVIADYIGTFVVFLNYDAGQTTYYYWILRINQLAFATILVFTNGLFPLLLKHSEERSLEELQAVNKTYYNLTSFLNQLGYGLLIITSGIYLRIILPSEYLSGIYLMLIFSFGHMVKSQSSFFTPQLLAFGGRFWYVVTTMVQASFLIILPPILSRWGLEALATSVIIAYIVKFIVFIFLNKKLKYKKKLDLLMPLLIGFAVLSIAMLLYFVASNILILEILFAFAFVIITYIVARTSKLIGSTELSIINKLVPKRYSKLVRKVLI